ncbi:MAG TPA: T9SS type A sorting domain-containing protein [Chitinophagales bacterium]|nr:T9SS type A sorting domain-containing protein [Chitinophagales bacterium]
MKNHSTWLLLLLCSSYAWAQNAAPTYYKDISPIIYQHCTSCHRSGEIGSRSFTNYEEVLDAASAIQYETYIRHMPPWKADPEYRHFLGENYLTDAQVQTITDWVSAGAPAGNPADEAQMPNFPEGSQIGTPDLVLPFAQAYAHAGDGSDEYRYFVLPTGLTQDQDIKCIEMRPGNTQIVHHALFQVDTEGSAAEADSESELYGFTDDNVWFALDGSLPGYAPGQKPPVSPPTIGHKLPANSDLVVQMHYAPTFQTQTDSSVVNIFFADQPIHRYIETKVMLPTDIVNGLFFMFGGEVKTFHGVWDVPKDISLLSIAPHCHLLGKTWEVYAITPSNDTINLVRVPDWDFHWQRDYQFEKLLYLPKNTTIHAFATYDNSTNNPNNPDPTPGFITWGENTTDEMYYLPISYVNYQTGDENISVGEALANPEWVFPKNQIYPIYPNPTNGQLVVGFSLIEAVQGTINIYGLDGKLLKNVASNTNYLPGKHSLSIEIGDLPSGEFIVAIESNKGHRISQKVILMR